MPKHKCTAPPVSTFGGCLRATAQNGAASSENYWQLEISWEDLGVPIGSIVKSVKASYQYRWSFRARSNKRSMAVFSGSEAASGPFEFRTKSDDLIDTFSARQFCIERTLSSPWTGYPEGFPSDPIVATPSSWARVVGDEILVPENISESHASIHLRLRSLSPATAIDELDPSLRFYVRFKQDFISVQVEYVLRQPSIVLEGSSILTQTNDASIALGSGLSTNSESLNTPFQANIPLFE